MAWACRQPSLAFRQKSACRSVPFGRKPMDFKQKSMCSVLKKPRGSVQHARPTRRVQENESCKVMNPRGGWGGGSATDLGPLDHRRPTSGTLGRVHRHGMGSKLKKGPQKVTVQKWFLGGSKCRPFDRTCRSCCWSTSRGPLTLESCTLFSGDLLSTQEGLNQQCPAQ